MVTPKNIPQQVYSFLQSNCLITIATISKENDYPYVLPVFYTTDGDSQFYFASPLKSKKIDNIIAHPHIGASITDSVNLLSLQLQGTARITKHDQELVLRLIELANEKSGENLSPMMQIEPKQMVVVSLSINWYRLANYSGKSALFVEGFINNNTE